MERALVLGIGLWDTLDSTFHHTIVMSEEPFIKVLWCLTVGMWGVMEGISLNPKS